MRALLRLCAVLFSTAAFAGPPPPAAGKWTNIMNVAFGHGYSDMQNAPDNLLVQPAKTDKLAVLMSRECQGINFEELYVRSYGTWLREYTDYQEVSRQQTPYGEWVYFGVTSPLPISFLGFRVNNYGNHVCYVETWRNDTVAPPPPPPPSEWPTQRQCEKVAFEIKYEYDTKIEQSTILAGTIEHACGVYIRFVGIDGYRYFLDKRREQGKSPDFEIMQPENVKVEFTHAVIN
jgi:hypothetical protein